MRRQQITCQCSMPHGKLIMLFSKQTVIDSKPTMTDTNWLMMYSDTITIIMLKATLKDGHESLKAQNAQLKSENKLKKQT